MLRETAQATVYVSHTSSKKQIHNCRKHGGSDVFVMPRHGAGLDLTQESIANNELVPLMPLGYKRVYFREIIAVIAIANDNELPFSFFNSSAQGAAVPSGDRCAGWCWLAHRKPTKIVDNFWAISVQSSDILGTR